MSTATTPCPSTKHLFRCSFDRPLSLSGAFKKRFTVALTHSRKSFRASGGGGELPSNHAVSIFAYITPARGENTSKTEKQTGRSAYTESCPASGIKESLTHSKVHDGHKSSFLPRQCHAVEQQIWGPAVTAIREAVSWSVRRFEHLKCWHSLILRSRHTSERNALGNRFGRFQGLGLNGFEVLLGF